jgi:hypothetical protein
MTNMQKNQGRYVFVFEYDQDWMIVCYKYDEDRCSFHNTKYFNSAEDDWDDALDYVDLFLENGGKKYWYKLPDYDHIANIDIFQLDNKPIEELAEYLS